jgi:hypothetical protein
MGQLARCLVAEVQPEDPTLTAGAVFVGTGAALIAFAIFVL